MGQELYRRIPPAHRLQVDEIRYASPGFIELAGLFVAMVMMGKYADAWVGALGKAFDLYVRVEKYFADRKLSPAPKSLDLDRFSGTDIDEARRLCFAFGARLGYSGNELTSLIEITGSPISALRFLLSLADVGQDLAQLVATGKLKVPALPSKSTSDDPTG